jgi:hypothetical protein
LRQVEQRLAQFRPGGPGAGMTLLLTAAPTFLEKTAALLGLSRIVALHHRSSTSHQI